MKLNRATDVSYGPRALYKLNKRLKTNVSRRQAATMVFLFKLGPMVLHRIAIVLRRQRMTTNTPELAVILKDLQSKGMVNRDPTSRKWSTTIDGIDFLNQYEEQLRRERHDR
jgi:hypothetical protein